GTGAKKSTWSVSPAEDWSAIQGKGNAPGAQTGRRGGAGPVGGLLGGKDPTGRFLRGSQVTSQLSPRPRGSTLYSGPGAGGTGAPGRAAVRNPRPRRLRRRPA